MSRLEEIKARSLELRTKINSLSGEELDNAIAELKDLAKESSDIEKRQAALESIKANSFDANKIEKPVEEPKTYGLDSAEYRSAFLKNLQGAQLNDVEKRAMTTAIESVGAAVPTETMNKIIEKLRDAGVIYPLVSQLHIPSNVNMPVEGTIADLSWKAEGETSSDSNDTLGKVELTAYELIKTVEITAQVEAMSIDAFENWLVASLAKKVKVAIDNAIINGNNSGQANGILNAVTPIDTAVTGTIAYDDIMNTIAALPSGYDQNATFVMNKKTLYKQIAKIKDDQKMPIFKLETDGRFAGKLLGYPVVTYDNCPEGKVILGDFEYYYFNVVKDFEITKDTSVGFKSGKTCFRALGLCDGDVALAEAFVVLNCSTPASV